jgi:CheY-like chemotaxis protein
MTRIQTALLVDDDHINNFINERLIKKLDFCEEIVIKNNGREALAFIEERCRENKCPDFIILDNKMPIMDGEEFMKAFNKLNISHDKVLVLLVTANSSPHDIDKYKILGIKEFTQKPLTEKLIIDLCQRHF